MAAPSQAGEGSRAVKRTLEFIRHHRLQKGDRLPSGRELPDRFGVTRSAVRGALAVLDALRLTERRPKSGIFLRNALEDSGLDSLVVQANEDSGNRVKSRRAIAAQAPAPTDGAARQPA
jgi:DNA-binding FadR family transcriptional regulator